MEFKINKKKLEANTPKKVFIASPYNGDIEENLRQARIYCKFAYEQNCIPYAPHLFFPQFLDENIEEERAEGIRMGLQMMDLMDEVWVFGEMSPGMEQEVTYALVVKKPVKFLNKEVELENEEEFD